MQHTQVNSDAELAALCDRLRGADAIAFDTEFVSEDTYWPHLCLVQVATDDELAVIDPLQLSDVAPFWTTLAEGSHTTVVHAGREELRFSLHSTDARPHDLFDVQIAAGLVGLDYPAGYGSLVHKLQGKRPPKGETRTDWRRRPLTKRQIEYALSDVTHLLPMWRKLQERLRKLGRATWLDAEMETWQSEIEAYGKRQRWRRVSGISGLSPRSLAVVRALWVWREEEAQRLDRPAKRVLRDDLIIEMARRASADPQRIRGIRGIERTSAKNKVPELADAIAPALELPDDELPRRSSRELPAQLNVLGQFLSPALTSICRSSDVAPSLVGTASDVRELIAWRLGYGNGEELPPELARGWRAEIVGTVLDDLLAGRTAIRIADPRSDHPLRFEPGGPKSK